MPDDEKLIAETIKTLGVSSLLPQVYEDLLQPASREIGQGLLTVAKTVRIAMAPLEGAVWGYDQIREWLSVKLTQRLARVDQDSIRPPPLSLAGPILLGLRFTLDEEELREMYANLLASSMTSEATRTHPAFVSVIQQLCPDEARVLNHINTLIEEDTTVICKRDSRDVQARSPNWVEWQFAELCQAAGVSHPDQSGSYLDNLLRLKVLNSDQQRYSRFVPEHSDDHGFYGASVEHDTLDEIWVTEFGADFLATCVR